MAAQGPVASPVQSPAPAVPLRACRRRQKLATPATKCLANRFRLAHQSTSRGEPVLSNLPIGCAHRSGAWPRPRKARRCTRWLVPRWSQHARPPRYSAAAVSGGRSGLQDRSKVNRLVKGSLTTLGLAAGVGGQRRAGVIRQRECPHQPAVRRLIARLQSQHLFGDDGRFGPTAQGPAVRPPASPTGPRRVAGAFRGSTAAIVQKRPDPNNRCARADGLPRRDRIQGRLSRRRPAPAPSCRCGGLRRQNPKVGEQAAQVVARLVTCLVGPQRRAQCGPRRRAPATAGPAVRRPLAPGHAVASLGSGGIAACRAIRCRMLERPADKSAASGRPFGPPQDRSTLPWVQAVQAVRVGAEPGRCQAWARRRAMPPISPIPASIRAQAPGSGTAVTFSVTSCAL